MHGSDHKIKKIGRQVWIVVHVLILEFLLEIISSGKYFLF